MQKRSEKLAVAFALAQSAKLGVFEATVELTTVAPKLEREIGALREQASALRLELSSLTQEAAELAGLRLAEQLRDREEQPLARAAQPDLPQAGSGHKRCKPSNAR